MSEHGMAGQDLSGQGMSSAPLESTRKTKRCHDAAAPQQVRHTHTQTLRLMHHKNLLDDRVVHDFLLTCSCMEGRLMGWLV